MFYMYYALRVSNWFERAIVIFFAFNMRAKINHNIQKYDSE